VETKRFTHTETIIRWADLKALVSLSKSTVWRLEQQGRFPRRRRLGFRAVGWLASEVQEWMRATGQRRSIDNVVRRKDDA
jgi:prophage regulatory protein